MSELAQRIRDDVKVAMKSGDKQRVAAMRLITAALKQREVDERITLDDEQVLAMLDKMVKQRRESISQFRGAGRDDLADKEQYELELLQEYLPAALSETELQALIEQAITEAGAESARDMGRVMAIVKPAAQGRADMAEVSRLVKARLA